MSGYEKRSHAIRNVGAAAPLEIWGGVEYTCNRVNDDYFDQMDLSGHSERVEDYDKIADLGIQTLRIGLLWERHERRQSWRCHDAHMQKIQQLGIRPIAGLVHHGSGPLYTSLLDPGFPEKLATYALKVARRYPWVDAYTPVNEPNTTARFSGMYGVWYPHKSSTLSYLQSLLIQLKATVLSMRAIRSVQPRAQLVQTDDVGAICGTSELRHICEVLDKRRWLPFDLLCGRVDTCHPMFSYMVLAGVAESDILWFADNPCPPSRLGINYYLTSDRYLDHRVQLYDESSRSAEGHFVDIESVRVLPQGISGVDTLLREAWQRYKIPCAITEVHLGASAEEQIRWLAESWDAVATVRREGVECVGLTIWALLGSFYWNQLVTRANGHYEPGAFRLQDGDIVRTELATVVAQIARGERPVHEALSASGWWRHPDRICYPHAAELAA